MADNEPDFRQQIETLLRELPRRAIVAFAARCARRVQPLYRPSGQNDRYLEAIANAIALAERFAAGERVAANEVQVAAEAADAAYVQNGNQVAYSSVCAVYAAGAGATYAVTPDPADISRVRTAADHAADAASFAVQSADYAASDVRTEALNDLEWLEAADLGKPDTLGKAIPLTLRNGLGPLWPNGTPLWFVDAVKALNPLLLSEEVSSPPPSQSEALRAQADKASPREQDHQEQLRERNKRLEALTVDLKEARRDLSRCHQERLHLEEERDSLQRVYEEQQQRLKSKSFGELAAEIRADWQDKGGRRWRLASYALALLMVTALPGLLIVGMLMATSEIISRQQVMSAIVGWIDEAEERQSLLRSSDCNDTDRARLLETQLDVANHLKHRMRMLAANGAGEAGELSEVREAFREGVIELELVPQLASGSLCPPVDEPNQLKGSRGLPRFLSPGRWNNDSLLSLAVILSGVIGSVATVARERGVALRVVDVVLGAIAGFIALLAIRAGKSIFLLELQETSVVFNPYTSAAAGFVAGAFTDKAFKLLTDALDKALDRIYVAFDMNREFKHPNNGNGAPNQQETSNPDPTAATGDPESPGEQQ